MTTNGRRRPPRPAIQVIAPAASPEQAAAIAAALERFLHDTAPTIAPRRPVANPWERAALAEGVVPPGTESLGRPAAVGQLAPMRAKRIELRPPSPNRRREHGGSQDHRADRNVEQELGRRGAAGPRRGAHSLRNIKAVDLVSTGLRGDNLDEWRAHVRVAFLVERVSE